jgi:hypothetical protein
MTPWFSRYRLNLIPRHKARGNTLAARQSRLRATCPIKATVMSKSTAPVRLIDNSIFQAGVPARVTGAKQWTGIEYRNWTRV